MLNIKKGIILLRMLAIKQLMDPTDLQSIYIPTMEVNWDQELFVLQNIFCVQHKKETNTDLEQHDGELMAIFN